MANTKSAKKRTIQNEKRRLRNRYKLVMARNLFKKLLKTTDKAKAQELLPQVTAVLDKLAQSNIIHRNTAGNNKGRIARHVNKLA